MTVIAGMVDRADKSVRIAADSGAWDSNDETTDIVPYTKLFGTSPTGDVQIIIGFAGRIRLAQIVHYAVLPHITKMPDIDSAKWIALDFYNVVHDAFVQYGGIKADEPFDMHGVMLVGIANKLFHVSERFEVTEALRGYDAIGSGRLAALGAFHAYESTEPFDPSARLYRVLTAAEAHLAEIKRPFMSMSTRDRTHYSLSTAYGDEE